MSDKPTTTIDPMEVIRVAREALVPETADAYGGAEPFIAEHIRECEQMGLAGTANYLRGLSEALHKIKELMGEK